MSKVYLVGAGPGDPGLLTVKAKELLERADVVVYDYLANKAFVDLARPDARRIYVGKKGGDHTLPQDQINELLVKLAKEGQTIVRLKGGDPYVFGRGAEEAEELLEAGVSFEIVPGVTSAVAATAYAGIPVTHRSFASSVSFITGHEDPTKDASAHDWDALAKAASTLVFFMGVKNLPDISARLIKGGRPADTPAALIRWGTTCRQRKLVATLGTIAEECVKHGFAAPSIFVVGEVISLHEKLDWFSKRPLLGKGVVVTRSREQASSLVSRLTELGACTYEFPAIEIKPLEAGSADEQALRKTLLELACYDWLVFTSVNGVKQFFAHMDALRLDARALAGLKVGAIGPATADSLAARGIKADFVPEKYVAESVVDGLLALSVAGKRVLIPRARQAREVLPEELCRAGARVDVLPVYDAVPNTGDAEEIVAGIEAGEIHAITFASSSTAENFFAAIDPARLKPHADKLVFASIGPVTSQAVRKHGFAITVEPKAFTIPALADALVAHYTA